MLDLSVLEAPEDALARSAGTAGAPLMLAIDLIDEDPAQPRREFDPAALQELAATITARGVRQPISVRRHPAHPDRWLLNFGARRLRASRLAGLHSIPAFIDETADSYDQVIENEHRESLKPLELALFVQRQLQAGQSQAEIAERLGRSRSYVTFAAALIDAPDWLMTLYREGRCRGLTEIYELRRLEATYGEQVKGWSAARDVITRPDIAAFKAGLSPANDELASADARVDDSSGGSDASVPAGQSPAAAAEHGVSHPALRQPPLRKKASTAVLVAEHGDQVVEVLLDAVPEGEGDVYVRPFGGGERRIVSAPELKVLRVAAAVRVGV